MAGLKITIDIKGGDIHLTYDPPLRPPAQTPSVVEGEEVTFEASDRIFQWTVDFCPSNAKGGSKNPSGERSPFKGKKVGARGPYSKKKETVEKGRSGGSPGGSVFSYAVAAVDLKGAMYALDPDIRVRGTAVKKSRK
jgi:hypothetical protein